MGALLAGGTAVMAAVMVAAPCARAQTAMPPYTLSVFPGTPPAGATQPDDLAISADGKHLWVGYGNGVDTTGKGGPSTVVEYDIASGSVLKHIAIPGHVDGLKINPATGDVWATENEDGNPTLAVIDHTSGTFTIYRFSPTLITGGFDDLVFVRAPREGSWHDSDSPLDVFVVASSQVDTTTPVIVRICGPLLAANTCLKSALPGAPQSVWNVVANAEEATDMIGDPDSMTLDPAGELVLDNRSDDSLYIVRDPKAQHPVLRVPLSLAGNPVEVNDTIFTTSATSGVSSTAGTIFITDTSGNKIYMLTKPYFPANEIYTAANVANVIGLVDFNTGVVTPVASGFAGVHGLAFSPTCVAVAPIDRHEKDREENDDQ
jgi:DNA-binding beta-propeller fold protein YncE